jgi:hypothetical protein
VLQAGQITPLLLLGVVGFLHFHKRNGWLAGVCCLLIAVKPHLLYLFWLALLLWSVREQRWSILVSGLLAGLTALGVAFACNPAVIAQYREALIYHPPEQWISPTAGAMLRLAFGKDPFWLQFLPTVVGLIWFVPCWMRHRRAWNWSEQMPLLILVSFVTTSYGAWPFDLVVLLLPIVAIAARLANRSTTASVVVAIGCWMVINGLALTMNVLHLPSFWFIWMTPAVLIGYGLLSARRLWEA